MVVGDQQHLIHIVPFNTFNMEKKQLTFTVHAYAVAEIVNFEGNKSWIRWYLPDFSDNGNIDLPDGKYELANRVGDQLTVKEI